MKKYLEIIKMSGLLLLLFILVSTIAISDNTYKISVSVKQSVTSEDKDPAYTVINTYTKEKESPGVSVTAKISGSGEKEITDKDGVAPAEEDTATKGPDPIIKPPDLELDESPEEYNDEVSEWILYLLDKDPLSMIIEDFSQEAADVAKT